MFRVGNELVSKGLLSQNVNSFQGKSIEKIYNYVGQNMAEEIFVDKEDLSVEVYMNKLYLKLHNERYQLTETAIMKLYTWKNLPYYNVAQFKAETQISIIKDIIKLLPKGLKLLVYKGKILSMYSTSFFRLSNKYVLEHLMSNNYEKAEVYLSDFYLQVKFNEQHAFNYLGSDPFRSSIQVSNSETGFSRFKIQPFLLRVFCTNGCTMSTYKGAVSIGHSNKATNLKQIINDSIDELKEARYEQLSELMEKEVRPHLIKRIKDHLIRYHGFKNALFIQNKMQLESYEGRKLFELWDMLTTHSKDMDETHRNLLEELAGNMLIEY